MCWWKRQDWLSNFIRAMHKSGKPVGLMCIAPVMSGVLFGAGVKCTVGDNPEIAAAIESTGAEHRKCGVGDICIDEKNKLVTTPAYLLARRISEAATGINKLVDAVLAMA